MKIDVKKLLKKCLLWIVSLAIFIVGYYFVYLFCGYQRIDDDKNLKGVEGAQIKLEVDFALPYSPPSIKNEKSSLYAPNPIL